MSHADNGQTAARDDAQRAKMDALVGCVLLVGVVLSVALVVAGVAWHWVRAGTPSIEYTIPKMNLFDFVTAEIHDLLEGQFRPRLLISLGIAAILLTPYFRVLASLLFFAFVAHDWKYSAFTGFVLAVLTYSLFLR